MHCWENGVGGVAATAPLHPPRETEREMFRCEFGVAFNSPPVARARRRPSPVVPLSLPPSFLPSLLPVPRTSRSILWRERKITAFGRCLSVLRSPFCLLRRRWLALFLVHTSPSEAEAKTSGCGWGGPRSSVEEVRRADAEEDDDGKNNRGAAMSPACPVSASFSAACYPGVAAANLCNYIPGQARQGFVQIRCRSPWNSIRGRTDITDFFFGRALHSRIGRTNQDVFFLSGLRGKILRFFLPFSTIQTTSASASPLPF